MPTLEEETAQLAQRVGQEIHAIQQTIDALTSQVQALESEVGGISTDWADVSGKPAAVTALEGTNTGDETTATIKTKLGISTLSGSNTGDQDLSGYLTTATAASTYQPLAANLTSWAAIAPATKANDGAVVHLSGDETIEDTKTFEGIILPVGSSLTMGGASDYGDDALVSMTVAAKTEWRNAMQLTALATTTPGAGVTTALAIDKDTAGGMVTYASTGVISSGGGILTLGGDMGLNNQASQRAVYLQPESAGQVRVVGLDVPLGWATSGNVNAGHMSARFFRIADGLIGVAGPAAAQYGPWSGADLFNGSMKLTNLEAVGTITGTEQASPPAAPAANGYVLYAEDNGSGKTRLMVRFASGASQQVAIEP